MRRRLSHVDSKTPSPCEGSPTSPSCKRGSIPCCFCWCCCCSCSCLTVRNKEKEVCSRRASNLSTLESLQRNEESGRLTLEEASSWALSFNTLLDNPTGRDVFMEFLRSEHSDENMLFWQACKELKAEQRKAAIAEKTKQIYLDYISILSPKEVSIDATVRDTINSNMAMPTADIFDEAQAQIYALMHRDSYPRFLNSAIYQSLLQSLNAGNASQS
ncbi:regulator of G-protein signaling 20-like [Polypterus senegalus]|nr:regulator of G-protein signaling 20-like [Polypterus senegalus]